MSADKLVARAGAIVGPTHVTGAEDELSRFGTGQSKTAAACIVRPGGAPEVSELLTFAHHDRVSVIPVGKASRVSQQAHNVDGPRLYLDTIRMDHVLNLDEESLTVHVQSGRGALSLERILKKRELSLGDFPPAALRSTVGGLLAVRTPGKQSRRHGFIEDAVLGLSAVLPGGCSVHTRVAPRRATGPDLLRALCGSEGTLAVITSATFRIHQQPETRLLSAFTLPSFSDALAAVRLALREEAAPAAMRIYDAAEFAAHFPDLTTEPGVAVLVAATAGPTDLAACDRDLIASAAQAMDGTSYDDSIAATWWKQRTGQAEPPAIAPPDLQVSATPGRQSGVYDAMRAAADDVHVPLRVHASRFDLDGGVMFVSVGSADGTEPATGEALSAIESAAHDAGAYLLSDRNRAFDPYLTSLRAELDPNGIMNPGVLAE